jgi:hypothetical protein
MQQAGKYNFMSMKRIPFHILIFCLYLSINAGKSNAQSPEFQRGMINFRLSPGIELHQAQAAIQSIVPSSRISQWLHPQNTYLYNRNSYKISGAGNLQQIFEAEEKLVRSYRMSFSEDISPIYLCGLLKKFIPGIEIAEPRISERRLILPNDAQIAFQSYIAQVKADKAWDISQGDTSVIIAVIDNGINQQHEDLKSNIAPNYAEIPGNMIDDDNNGQTDDYLGANMAWPDDGSQAGSTYLSSDSHGSAVAGVAAASWSNGIGIAGAAGKCRFFPIKAGKEGSDRVEYGYEAILYAIQQGYRIINCSWGSPNAFMETNSLIAKLAAARNTLIVAAAGNDGNKVPYYPAAYSGVLGVGETDQGDSKTSGSTYGAHTTLMAPGNGVRTTDNSIDGYVNESGTSFASPIAAGCAALVLAHYPGTSMQQIAKHLSATADPIDLSNSLFPGFIPGRVNFERALSIPPDSLPLISTDRYQTRLIYPEGKRPAPGDTIRLSVVLQNYSAAPARNIVLKLRLLSDFLQPIELIDTQVFVPLMAGKTTITVNTPFRIKIKDPSDAEQYLRLDISSEERQYPFILLPMRPVPSILTFESEGLKFSLGNYGSIGFINSRTIGQIGNESFDGSGFILKEKGSMLFSGGLIAASAGKVLKGMPDDTQFEPSIPFAKAQQGAYSIMSDSLAPEFQRLGMQITTKVQSLTRNTVTLRYTILNRNSGQSISAPALGIYADWDIGNYGRNNRVELFPEALPPGAQGKAAAEIAWRPNQPLYPAFPFVSMLAFAPSWQNRVYTAQASGLNALLFDGSDAAYDALLKNDVRLQYDGSGDIAMSCGIRFNESLAAGDSATLFIIIGADTSRESLAASMQQAVRSADNALLIAAEKEMSESAVSVFMQDGKIHVSINTTSICDFQIFDLHGKQILEGITNQNMIVIPSENLSSGIYLLNYRTEANQKSSILLPVLH